MLTESDPRRANWLTITSMSEDVCWPDEPSTSRPNWELEAEILRLTTRLMMRERELRQAKGQLRTAGARAAQQSTSWRRRMEEKEEQVRGLLEQKDAEMRGIVSQLLLFESGLRREQGRIEQLLSEKDAQIAAQQAEIERLRGSTTGDAPRTPVRSRAIQDVTNVKDEGERRRARAAPQKMKDLKAKRIGTHKGHHRHPGSETTPQAIL